MTSQLSDEQRAHRGYIVQQADRLITAKYEKGALEHGGLITELSEDQLLDAAIEEAVDQIVYLLTLKEIRNDKATAK